MGRKQQLLAAAIAAAPTAVGRAGKGKQPLQMQDAIKRERSPVPDPVSPPAPPIFPARTATIASIPHQHHTSMINFLPARDVDVCVCVCVHIFEPNAS